MEKDIYTILPLPNKKFEFLKFHSPFFAYAYYKNFKINLLDGSKSKFSISALNHYLDEFPLNQYFQSPIIFHFFYEWGYSLCNLEDYLSENQLLAIEIRYNKVNSFRLKDNLDDQKINLKIAQQISLENYKKSFIEGYRHLLAGNCYQFNLTFKHQFLFERNYQPHHFYLRLWREQKNIGAYAHLSYIPYFNKMFLSNSPECLFQLKRKEEQFELFTMPIKGSKKFSNLNEVNALWKELRSSKKDEAELFMITDLLRNDLSKIEEPISEVVKKKEKLIVPGIIHQFSVIRVVLSLQVKLGRILNSLFPGGSITGAPKIRVLEILQKLERENRGFYTGSTVVLFQNIKSASINIRSAEIDFAEKQLTVGAGGGITLLSDPEMEYQEMMEKVNSFIRLLLT